MEGGRRVAVANDTDLEYLCHVQVFYKACRINLTPQYKTSG